MSKFCFKCGATVESDAEVCTNCGANINEAPAKKSKKPLVITLIIVGAILSLVVEILAGVILAPVVLDYFDSYPSEYTQAVDLYYNALYGGDVENVEKMAPKECWERLSRLSGKSSEECVQYAARILVFTHEKYETGAKGYGKDFDYSYTITQKTALTEEELGIIGVCLEEKYGISPNAVKEGYSLNVDLFLAQDEPRNRNLLVIKIGRKWYLVGGQAPQNFDSTNETHTDSFFFRVESYVSTDN